MSWRDLAWLCIIVLGVVLFLYGSNYYDVVVGWTGVYLMIGGLIAGVILRVWGAVREKKINQKP